MEENLFIDPSLEHINIGNADKENNKEFQS